MSQPTQTSGSAFRKLLILCAVLLVANAILFWLGFTQDAITFGTTVKKSVAGLITITVVDERVTYSVVEAIFRLWKDGNYVLFFLVFGFSVVFPILKWLGNVVLWFVMASRKSASSSLAKIAHLLHVLGRWSMLEVFMAALMCVMVKMGDVVRVVLHEGIFWFLSAVLLSMINALLSENIAKRIQ
jgi:paraquat-inducible protein A